MAKPRVFISSTYYDLKHLRSLLYSFVESLGFEPILSERGDIAFSPDKPLDESCYREVLNSDIFVLIIGGRYGSEISSSKLKKDQSFYQKYQSVTKQEFKNALDNSIPVYVLVESDVYSEYHTFKENRENKKIKYAHVDSVNIFHFIDDILSLPFNNPIKHFEKTDDIVTWLREQWAGLFRELLLTMRDEKQLSTMSAKIVELGEVSRTLKTYIEAILSGTSTVESSRIIESENKRLSEVDRVISFQHNELVDYLMSRTDISIQNLYKIFMEAESFADFAARINKEMDGNAKWIFEMMKTSSAARRDFNVVRKILGLKRFKVIGAL